MLAFNIKPENIKLTVGSNPTLPLTFTANPVGSDGKPIGLAAVDGIVYNAIPDGLPALLIYNDGGAEIRDTYTLRHIANARFVVSGLTFLIRDGQPTEINAPISVYKEQRLNRIGIGIRHDGSLIAVVSICTLDELQLALQVLGADDALLITHKDAYLNYPEGGIQMGIQPVTLLEAINVKELPRPVVIIDPGHGGSDPGACGFGLKEKDFTLRGAQIVQAFLASNYEGTFLLTHEGTTMPLEKRTRLENAMQADLFISLHHNAGGGTGFESYTYTNCSNLANEYQKIIHTKVMDYLASWGVRDRGMKKANFWVLRKTKCPAVLTESLFMDTLQDIELLKNDDFFVGLYQAIADGIARSLKLIRKQPKETQQTESQALYRVQVGAFRYRRGAEKLLEELKKAGFDGFIKRE